MSGNVIDICKQLIDRAVADEIDYEVLMYASNLLENAIIDAYIAGKISKETMDKFLLSDES